MGVSQTSVNNPPEKPTMVYDGDCSFCKSWIKRWSAQTGDSVEYVPYQSSLDRFPEIPEKQFASAVQVVNTDGKVYRAAAAVFFSLQFAPGKSWLYSLYKKNRVFAFTSELVYGFVANNRSLLHKLSRLVGLN